MPQVKKYCINSPVLAVTVPAHGIINTVVCIFKHLLIVVDVVIGSDVVTALSDLLIVVDVVIGSDVVTAPCIVHGIINIVVCIYI